MNLFDLEAKILLDTHGFETGIKAAQAKMQSAVGAVQNFTAKVVDFGEAVIDIGEKASKTFLGIETAIGTAVGTLIKTSVEGYGEFEQLVGGVETLFGAGGQSIEEYAESVGKSVDEVKEEYDRLIQSQDEVIQNAANAYKTAGLSANDYMQTVTSFSASLLQGLGGDTAKAAEYADVAITDMADNANKMGTDIGAIQFAYQGFAKQNYTMLDNLKLGFGGSASEMARLINESGVLGDAIEVTAKTVKDVPFDKVIEAIHVIQTNLGITGTTAKEAASTIQGSVASAKTAFTNFAVGLADGTQDIDLLFDNLIESVGIAADNIAPRIISAIDRISDTVEKRSDQIADFIGGIASEAAEQVPKFLDITTSILQNVIKEVGENENELKEAGISLFEQILTAFEETVDLALPIAEGLLPTIISAFLRYEGTLFETGVKIIMSFVRGVADQSDELADSAFSALETMLTTVDENLDEFLAAGEKIIDSLISSLDEHSESLQGTAESIITKLVEFAAAKLPDVLALGLTILEKVMLGITNNIGKLTSSATEIVGGLAEDIGDELPTLIPTAVDMILEIADALTDPKSIENLLDGALAIVIGLADGIIESLPNLLDKAPVIVENLVDAIILAVPMLIDAAVVLIEKLAEYITDRETMEKIYVAAGEIVGKIIGGLLNLEWELRQAGLDILNKIKDGFFSLFKDENGNPENWGKNLVDKVIGGLTARLNAKIEGLKSVWNGIKSIFTDEEPEDTRGGGGGSFGGGGGATSKTPYHTTQRPTGTETEINFTDKVADATSGLIVSNNNAGGTKNFGNTSIVNNITVNGADAEDDDALASKIAEEIGKQMTRKKAGGFTGEIAFGE